PLVHRRSTIDALGECRSREERDRFYRQVWDTPRWRWLFRFFFSQWVMARLGRDPSYFAHVGGSFSERLLLRTHMALVAQPTHNNPFLAYVLKGTYPLDALPMYLLPEHYPIIRARLDRLQPVCESLGRYLLGAVGWFDGFNLSDLFEYLSPELHEALYVALLERARSGGRLVYWNLQVPRGIPSPCTVRARSLEEVSRELRERDRIWFYEALHVDEVSGGAGTLIPKLEVASKTP
ncbi:MAG TPA: DUF3419 family protein, partial [Armatimonadota bacterium]|nr:DUF3419 family protein [Armatimonadota bacterium]